MQKLKIRKLEKNAMFLHEGMGEGEFEGRKFSVELTMAKSVVVRFESEKKGELGQGYIADMKDIIELVLNTIKDEGI